MLQVPIEEAGAQLSHLVQEAAGGEQVILTQDHRPVARLVAIEPARQPP